MAIARGLIEVQVPFEAPMSEGSVEVFYNGTLLATLPVYSFRRGFFGLFDTGDWENSLRLPSLAALNQDGTVNSKNNPAANGSIISLFGSGVGPLSPQLTTGELNPTASLSQSSALCGCLGCSEILYLGSAPGLSTSVVQVSVRLTVDQSNVGVHTHPL